MDLKQILAHACHFNHTSVWELHLMSDFNWTETLHLNPGNIYIDCLQSFFTPSQRTGSNAKSKLFDTHTTARFTVMKALLVPWPDTVAPGWGGLALWIPAECSWPQPACCLTSIEGGGLFPSRCWRLRMGSLREFWRQASTWTRDLSLSGEKTQNYRGKWLFLSCKS